MQDTALMFQQKLMEFQGLQPDQSGISGSGELATHLNVVLMAGCLG